MLIKEEVIERLKRIQKEQNELMVELAGMLEDALRQTEYCKEKAIANNAPK